MVIAFPVLILAGCSDSLVSTAPSPSTFSASTKGLGKTLSPDERKAAIADLQNAQTKREGVADDGATASVKPVQAQN